MKLTPATPLPTSQEERIELLFNFIGLNAQKSAQLMDILQKEHNLDLTSLSNKDGVPLMTKAIQMNDGYVASYLMEKGLDIHQPMMINTQKSMYEYAMEMKSYDGRATYAWDAIHSFLELKEKSPVIILTQSQVEDLQNQPVDVNGKTVKLYMTTPANEENLLATLKMVKEGLKPGTKLKLKPEYQEDSLNLEIEVPREQVAIDNEPVEPQIVFQIDMAAEMGRIVQAEQALLVAEYHANVQYCPTMAVKEVKPSYGQTPGEFYRVTETLDDARTDLIQEIQHAVTLKPAMVINPPKLNQAAPPTLSSKLNTPAPTTNMNTKSSMANRAATSVNASAQSTPVATPNQPWAFNPARLSMDMVSQQIMAIRAKAMDVEDRMLPKSAI